MTQGREESTWTFITNHTAILLTIVEDPTLTVREIANRVGITERRAAQIIRDLREAGYIEVERVGRRSRYTLRGGQPLHRFPLENVPLGEFLQAVRRTGAPAAAAR